MRPLLFLPLILAFVTLSVESRAQTLEDVYMNIVDWRKAEMIRSVMTSGDPDCKCKGIRLYGKVQVVDAFEDLKVQVVDAFSDIDVQVVSSFPDECGKWQFVSAFPDFKIKFVDAFADIKIRYVDAFPGMK